MHLLVHTETDRSFQLQLSACWSSVLVARWESTKYPALYSGTGSSATNARSYSMTRNHQRSHHRQLLLFNAGSQIVFSRAAWIGSLDENPDEVPMELPAGLMTAPAGSDVAFMQGFDSKARAADTARYHSRRLLLLLLRLRFTGGIGTLVSSKQAAHACTARISCAQALTHLFQMMTIWDIAQHIPSVNNRYMLCSKRHMFCRDDGDSSSDEGIITESNKLATHRCG
jgi:hypothetical protein